MMILFLSHHLYWWYSMPGWQLGRYEDLEMIEKV